VDDHLAEIRPPRDGEACYSPDFAIKRKVHMLNGSLRQGWPYEGS
jgi:hypothetical protein